MSHNELHGFRAYLDQVASGAERDMARSNLILAHTTDFNKLGWKPSEAEIDRELERIRSHNTQRPDDQQSNA